ncbi:hypothetical protein FA15DRAFT_710632 [Coprinopsis marcescibilis]|uniref:FHA domain-containing protein n=1 Tax=Coprinopsis marcescibilis TaxID=230819 RepID=A0A5C3KCG2_COPMA|nr:hypothetical protein FA15DRAFT_710632 [Coprinopsis marcescibilis]
MPAPAPFSAPITPNLPYPALYLYPLNDSFVPKHIALSHGQHVKIGRQTNAKTAPAERNGYFDSKVLSRQHAEVWEDGGKVFIKDVKSSNGTFINGERLSSEGVESDPFELKSDDIVEFGIDIVGEDNKTIIHHKVAARVLCVFSEQEALIAARAEQFQQQQQQQHQHQHQSGGVSSLGMGQAGPSAINGAQSGFNFNNNPQRRPQMNQPSLGGMGGMGGGMRPPGKSGLTFDVILSRLQGEFQKARETGAELTSVGGILNEAHETLSGGLPTNLPPYPSTLPPVRPVVQEPQPPPAPVPSPPPPPTVPPSVITELQTQLRDTQSSLASEIEKIRALETVRAEQEAVKHEVQTLRQIMEARRRNSESNEPRGGFDVEEDEEGENQQDLVDDDDDDDARSVSSVSTVVPHELESVEEEDEEGLEAANASMETEEREQTAEADAQEEMQRQQTSELGRPITPEPIEGQRRDADSYETSPPHTNGLLSAPRRASPTLSSNTNTNDDLLQERIAQLTAQVSQVMQLTSVFEAQHSVAQSTIQALEKKVEALEAVLAATQEAARSAADSAAASAAAVASVSAASTTPVSTSAPTTNGEKKDEGDSVAEQQSLTDRISEWMKAVDGKWDRVQDEWHAERERLHRAREEWESKIKAVDERVVRLGDEGKERFASLAASISAQAHGDAGGYGGSSHRGLNGDAAMKNGLGLVTPPSPRSIVSESPGRYTNRRRRRRSSGSRGRSRSRSEDGVRGASPSPPERRGSSGTDEADGELHSEAGESSVSGSKVLDNGRTQSHAVRALATPEPSVYKAGSSPVDDEHGSREDLKGGVHTQGLPLHPNNINVQTAMGVLLLSVAAAAVIWKVKPE